MKKLGYGSDRKTTDIAVPVPRHYGVLNSGRTLYYINEDNADAGFFAMYRYWLEYLYFADVLGCTPVINAGDSFAYREKKKINGSRNAFEYYFEQPGGISAGEAELSRSVVCSELNHKKMVELVFTGKVGNYKYTERYLRMMAHIARKYIRFNELTKQYLEAGLSGLHMAGRKVLGVHIRGTDFRAKYDNHPLYIQEEECFAVIDKMMAGGQFHKIFLATDDARILGNFTKKYGGQLCFYEDVTRNSTNRSVVFTGNKRENHKYLLGLEVIRDMYTLSACSGLVGGISQVAVCAQITKLARKEKYERITIIDKGLYHNSHIFGIGRT